jgi:hypothetical protein
MSDKVTDLTKPAEASMEEFLQLKEVQRNVSFMHLTVKRPGTGSPSFTLRQQILKTKRC